MKLNVGDCVRTKDYGFIKIKSFYYSEDMIHILDENYNEYGFSKELVDDFKTSPNIIDLIEVGDYVNGIYIDTIEKEQKRVWHTSCYGDDDIVFYNNDIKSIVTKEMYSSIEYKVGD